MRYLALTATLLTAVCGSTAIARDWPQWRGPFLNGSTDEKNLPVTWSAAEGIKWTAAMPGRGYATPIVSNGRVFTTSTVTGSRSNDLLGICLDEKSGEVLWKKKLALGYLNYRSNNQASCSPVSDGKVVCFLFGSGVLTGVDFSGKVLWRRDLVREFGPMGAKWGYSSSPLLYAGKVYVQVLRSATPYRRTLPDGTSLPAGLLRGLQAYLLCVDPGTGKTLFRHVRRMPDLGDDREAHESYATPVAHETGGKGEIVLVGGDHLTGHDPDTGKENWRWCYNPKQDGIWRRVVPSPVVAEGFVFGIRSQDKPKYRPLYALKLGQRGTIPPGKYAWRFPGGQDVLGVAMTDVCTPLYYKGRLYLLCDDKKTLSCLEPKTGRMIWHKSVPGAGGRGSMHWGSATGADDKIYVIDDMGTVTVIAAGDEYKVLAKNHLDAKNCLSTVVAANGCLFLRSRDKLFCIGPAKAE